MLEEHLVVVDPGAVLLDHPCVVDEFGDDLDDEVTERLQQFLAERLET